MSRWIKDYDPKPFIDKLNKTRRLTKDGNVQFSGFDMYTIPARLDAMVQLSEDVPEYERYSIVKQAIWVAGKKRITTDSVLREINRLEKEFIVCPEKHYILLTSLSVDARRKRLKNLQVDNCRIIFGGKLKESFAKARRKAAMDFSHILNNAEYPSGYIRAKVNVKAKTFQGAVTKALYALNLTRGFLNLANNCRLGHSFSTGGQRKPINKIVLGPIHTLHERNGKLALDGIWYQPDYRGLSKVFSPPVVGEFEKIVSFAEKLRSQLKKCQYRVDLENLIVRYCQALDSYDWNAGFVELWSILEYLTNTLENRYKITVKRAAFIWEDHEGARQTLSLLRDFRNKLVHKGLSNTTIEVFIYDLKIFVEQLLLFLIFNRSNFKSIKEAAEFLDQPKDVKIIEKRLKLLNYAKRLRKGDQRL